MRGAAGVCGAGAGGGVEPGVRKRRLFFPFSFAVLSFHYFSFSYSIVYNERNETELRGLEVFNNERKNRNAG